MLRDRQGAVRRFSLPAFHCGSGRHEGAQQEYQGQELGPARPSDRMAEYASFQFKTKFRAFGLAISRYLGGFTPLNTSNDSSQIGTLNRKSRAAPFHGRNAHRARCRGRRPGKPSLRVRLGSPLTSRGHASYQEKPGETAGCRLSDSAGRPSMNTSTASSRIRRGQQKRRMSPTFRSLRNRGRGCTPCATHERLPRHRARIP